MSNQISFDEFQKVDVRIGTIKKAEVPEWSHWAMELIDGIFKNYFTISSSKIILTPLNLFKFLSFVKNDLQPDSFAKVN